MVHGIGSYLVKIDPFSDYIPLGSTITNAIILFPKYAVLPSMSKEQIVSGLLKDDRDVVFVAVRQNGSRALQFASKRLQQELNRAM